MNVDDLKNETNKVWGSVVYDIIYNTVNGEGNIPPKMYVLLNGLWTNNKSQTKVMNEIARKNSDLISNEVIVGDYNCSFIETNGSNLPETVVCELKIAKRPNSSYQLIWKINNKEHFEGVGFKIDKHLVVTYWEK